MPSPYGADRQSALSRPNGRQSVFADLELQRTAGPQQFLDVRNGLCRHQRQPAADDVQYQCRAARARRIPPRGSRSDPRWAKFARSRTARHSIYHGLQSKIEKRFSRGLYFLASYTWSKSIDNQSNGTDDSAASGQYPQDPNNAALDRGLSSFDRTHRFVGSAVWEIPFGRTGHNAFRRIGIESRGLRRMAVERHFRSRRPGRRSAC